jgi:hypothetical protein
MSLNNTLKAAFIVYFHEHFENVFKSKLLLLRSNEMEAIYTLQISLRTPINYQA